MVFVLSEGNAVSMAILANLPQVFLALIYVVYNGLITSMFVADDWSNFAFKAQALMVSSPTGKQRGTWLLGAPVQYGFPLLALHTLLHWCVSQSIFVVQVDLFKADGVHRFDRRLSNCGYSPIAIIFSLLAGFVLFVTALLLGLRKFRKGSPPVVSTCSAAISAAYHPGISVQGMIYNDLRWGEVGHVETPVGHCSLAPAELWDNGQGGYARPVQNGRLYAGL